MKKKSGRIGALTFCVVMLFSFAAFANGSGDVNSIYAEDAYKAKIIKKIGQGKRFISQVRCLTRLKRITI